METIEIHLAGAADPDGSIDLALLAPLAAALVELSGRVVRWQAGRSGPAGQVGNMTHGVRLRLQKGPRCDDDADCRGGAR